MNRFSFCPRLLRLCVLVLPCLPWLPVGAVPLANESFAGYSAGNLPGNAVAAGYLPGSSWSGLTSAFAGSVADASKVSTGNGLLWRDLVVNGNHVRVKGDGSNTRAMMDISAEGPFGVAGLVDTASGTIGGGNVEGTMYLSFLFRAVSTNRASEYGGLQFARSNSDQTGILIGNNWNAWAYSLNLGSTGLDLKDKGGTGVWKDMDNQTRLMVARIDFKANANDRITVWVDPELANGESDQNLAGVYMGTMEGNFSFDRYFLRGGNATREFDYDEIRMGTTWNDVTPMSAQPLVLENETVRATVRGDGTLAKLSVKRNDVWEAVPFRNDTYRGPSWQVEEGGTTQSVVMVRDAGQPSFSGVLDGRAFRLTYELGPDGLKFTARAENTGTGAWTPQRASVRLGLDTYMATYPEWRALYFPTLLRCEATHFWGYAMTPASRILAFGSPDKIASWHHLYEPAQHRIYTTVMDCLEAAAVPARHPQGQNSLAAGTAREWSFHLMDAPTLADVKPRLAGVTNAPMIDADRYTGQPGDQIKFTVRGDAASATFASPSGEPSTVALVASPGGVSTAVVTLSPDFGASTFRVTSSTGKVSEAVVNVRRPWSWVAKQARAEAISKPQKASSHTESWYGLFSGYAARKHFPSPTEDAAIDAKLDEIYPLMYSTTTGLPTSDALRIQNHASMAGVLAMRYASTGDLVSLTRAAALCDFLITTQRADGAYYSGSAHYTSVIYIAKSILEVCAEEKKLAAPGNIWQERYDRHYLSAKRAIEDLATRLDNIGTEGQATFEDGMISCSTTQLGMMALLETDPATKARYTNAAKFFADSHGCLDQSLIPDGRMNGGTLRFWEAQYDVLTNAGNFMNSPHGWSAWKIYGVWYLYQLTGETKYLREAMDALGACSQLIDPVSGELRWSFVSDPSVPMSLFTEMPGTPGKGRNVPTVRGEQYLPMISGWYRAPANTRVTGYWGGNRNGAGLAAGESWPQVWSGSTYGGDGGACDNDVHEIFKCLEEVALTSAYVIFHPDAPAETWNCTLVNVGGTTVIRPSEACVKKVHVHTNLPLKVTVDFQGKLVSRRMATPGWVEPVEADTAYDEWRRQEFGENYATMPSAMDDADADGDGLSNKIEFQLAGRSATVREAPPSVSRETLPEGDFFHFRLDRRIGAQPPATIEWSDNLGNWSVPATLPDGSMKVFEDATRHEVWVSPTVHPKWFFRIKGEGRAP